MTTRAWLVVMTAFAAGWMMHDASGWLLVLLGGVDFGLRIGFRSARRGPC